MPAQNVPPAPVSTPTRRSSSASSRSIASAIPCATAALTALRACGRSMVTTSTPSAGVLMSTSDNTAPVGRWIPWVSVVILAARARARARACPAALRSARRPGRSPAPRRRCAGSRRRAGGAAARRRAGRSAPPGRCSRSASMSITLRSARYPGARTPRSSSPTARAVSRAWRCTTNGRSRRAPSRSRVQCCSSVVGKLPSQIVPTCAPPSESPGTVCRWVSISCAASRLPSA